jgi:hypothetical protein
MERRRLLDGWGTAAWRHCILVRWSDRDRPRQRFGRQEYRQAGKRIYAEKYRQRFEASYADQFAAASSWVEAMAIWR